MGVKKLSDNRKNVSDMVAKKIEEKIFSGEWKPGTRITSEPQLAKELNVSRMSVREAIEKMAALGILSKKRGEGTFVNELSPETYLNSLIPMITLDRDNYLQVLEFRLIIDVESARLCAKRCDDKIIERLEKYYTIMTQYKDDSGEFSEADMNFHLTIAEGTNNPMITKVNLVLKNLMEYHQKALYSTLGPSGGISEHIDILNAIKNKDPELSALFMRRHIERTIKEIKKNEYKEE